MFVEVPEAGLDVQLGDGSYRFSGGSFRYQCVNYGRTPAVLVELSQDIQVLDAGKFPTPIDPTVTRGRELPTGCVATKDNPFSEGDTAMKTYPYKLLDFGASRKYTIFFIGFVCYRDMIVGTTYVNGFCFVYDHIGMRFVRRGDNQQYNYTRKETSSGHHGLSA